MTYHLRVYSSSVPDFTHIGFLLDLAAGKIMLKLTDKKPSCR